MGEVAIQLLKWSARITFILAAIMAYIVVLNIGLSAIFVSLNAGIISDLMTLVQAWAPFNLTVVTMWLWASAGAYFTYRMALASLIWLHRMIG